jgi:hypothetical protein
MAASGNWFGNAALWYIGYILLGLISNYIGWLKYFGVWQFGVDTNFALMGMFFPTDLVEYTAMMDGDMSNVDG